MNTQQDKLLGQFCDYYGNLCHELSLLEKRLTEVKLLKSAFESVGMSKPIAAPAKARSVQRNPTKSVASAMVPEAAKYRGSTQFRADRGLVTDSILSALKLGPACNKEIRDRMKAGGYVYSLEMYHISKTLQRMVAQGMIKKTGPMNDRKYYVPATMDAVAPPARE